MFKSLLALPGLLFSKNSARYYELLGDDVVEGVGSGFTDPKKPLWLNLGYWKTARTYPEAATAMAALVAEAAQLGPEDHLLDVGFGFAEQDFFWIERYGVKRITGLNITSLHVERAQKRVKDRGLADRMDLRLGSATAIPFEPGTFDKVTALECAFHFDTRDLFFQQAFRALRPGGRIALADGVPAPDHGPVTFVNKLSAKRWSVPLANLYDRNEYVKRMEAAGFTDVRVESIRQYVLTGTLKYSDLRKKGLTMDQAVIELSPEEIASCWGIERWQPSGLTDYILASGRKPEASGAA